MKKFLLLCMGAMLALVSCTKDEPKSGLNDSAVAVAKFQGWFCDETGEIKITPMEGDAASWVVGVTSGEMVCRIFNDITGFEVSPVVSYCYEYLSSDHLVRIIVEGDLTANEEAVYAIMKVEIPDYPKVKKIYFVDPEYFNGVNLLKPIIL